MSQLLFRNRWFALVWAMLICFSISRFFDDGGGQEQLAKAAADIRASRAATSRVAAAREQSAWQQDVEESQVIRGRSVQPDSHAADESEFSEHSPGQSESEAY